jgi:hypothetical protein
MPIPKVQPSQLGGFRETSLALELRSATHLLYATTRYAVYCGEEKVDAFPAYNKGWAVREAGNATRF